MKEGQFVPIAATSNVLLLNGEGEIVDELHVTVISERGENRQHLQGWPTPFLAISYYCFGYGRVNLSKKKIGPAVVMATQKWPKPPATGCRALLTATAPTGPPRRRSNAGRRGNGGAATRSPGPWPPSASFSDIRPPPRLVAAPRHRATPSGGVASGSCAASPCSANTTSRRVSSRDLALQLADLGRPQRRRAAPRSPRASSMLDQPVGQPLAVEPRRKQQRRRRLRRSAETVQAVAGWRRMLCAANKSVSLRSRSRDDGRTELGAGSRHRPLTCWRRCRPRAAATISAPAAARAWIASSSCAPYANRSPSGRDATSATSTASHGSVSIHCLGVRPAAFAPIRGRAARGVAPTLSNASKLVAQLQRRRRLLKFRGIDLAVRERRGRWQLSAPPRRPLAPKPRPVR